MIEVFVGDELLQYKEVVTSKFLIIFESRNFEMSFLKLLKSLTDTEQRYLKLFPSFFG